ncbi:MAG: AAA family ATPase [Pyrinomonadaceae bacterium]
MYISRIELQDIKSHTSSAYDFGPGTTAITGENGAGKTTIIEAIAWVLFDLLEYKKEDFVRRGAKKGSVRITLESGLDERNYIVYRDTGAGYHVTDPRLQTRIADKKEEVFRFLWQHLGLEPGTDLRSLFRQAIGVPQGTFTAIFLEGSTERKIAFDRLLKVEEYRQAAEKLRETSRFLESSVAGVREQIARAEGELSRSQTLEEEHKGYAAQVHSLTEELSGLSADLKRRQDVVAQFDAQAEKVATLQAQYDRLRSERDKATLITAQLEESVGKAAAAAVLVENSRKTADRHVAVLGLLAEMERERIERDRIRAELARVDAAIANVIGDQKRLLENLESAVKAKQEVAGLTEKADEQLSLEKEVLLLRDQVATGRTAAAQIVSIDERLERLRRNYADNRDRLKEAEEKSAMAAELSLLEARTGELMQSLATLQASLDRDEKFQSEIKNGLCPVLSQKCLNLRDGETLQGFVSSQFVELRSQIGVLENERLSVTEKLALAREASRAAAAVESLRHREAELAEEGKRLKQDKEALSSQAAALQAATDQLSSAEARLKALEDPGSRIRYLEAEAVREAEYREKLSAVDSNLERLQSERRLLVENMESYKDLDQQWASLAQEREATLESYRTFLANEAEAVPLSQRQAKLEQARAELASAENNAREAESELLRSASEYDQAHHQSEKAQLLESERRNAELRATLDAGRRRYDQLDAELKRFEEIRQSLQGEFKEKERLEKVSEAAAFIRDTLKEAAPRVARNYVHHVSLEANQMFREITGNAERTLKWAEDYSITLEESGYDRPFTSLSGGEQMAAALSVRLGLLKQLSDIRIAFFDEPTTNLDIERRENLAMQMSRITHFDQLFVISHDDTFEDYVDRTIRIDNSR